MRAAAISRRRRFSRGDEPVVLHRLTPGGDLRFYLPKVFLGFDTRFYDGTPRGSHGTASCTRVILEPDHPRVSLVWHTALPCHFKVQKLDRTIVTLKAQLARTRDAAEAHELEPGLSSAEHALHGVALGASTPVGREAWSSAAAVRAGISGFAEHPVHASTPTGEPMRVAVAPWLDI